MTATEIRSGRAPCACAEPHTSTKLVVLTGGPGAGKTAVLEVLRVSLCEHVAVLPEAATILFGGGFPRHESLAAREEGQVAIFQVQRALELTALREGRAAIVLCDRGTLDGLAYWPGPEAEFFQRVRGTRADELARYSAVIHMHSPSEALGYNHQNPARVESAEQARRLDDAVRAAWDGHDRRVFIPPAEAFLSKVALAVAAVRNELPPCCRFHPIAGERAAQSLGSMR